MHYVKVGIDAIRRSEMGTAKNQAVAILKEEGEERYLPIWVSSDQADILAAELQGLSIELRPAPELFLKSVNATCSDVTAVMVKFEKDIFYAKVLFYFNDGPMEVKCPFCVALSIAFRARVPIVVKTETMDKWALPLNDESNTISSNSIIKAADIVNSIANQVLKN